MQQAFCFPLALSAFLSIASLSLASSLEVNLKRDVRAAKSIVMGTVERTNSYYGGDGEIYTDVTLRVSANLKDGFGGPDSITFTSPGGEVGDVGVLFTTAPRFSEGEPVMVFLEETVTGSPAGSPAGLALRATAKYAMNLDQVPELGISPLELMLEVGREAEEAGVRVRDNEWRRGAEFLAQNYASKDAVKDMSTQLAAAAVCYKVMGPKWAARAASYKLDATLPAGFGPAVNAAAGTWSEGTSPYKFVFEGSSANVVNFAPITTAGVLASTRVVYQPSTNTIVSFTLTFNSNYSWSTGGEATKFDVQGIGTHELGHAMGLDHPSDASCSEQTMWASAAAGETKKRSLETGDKEGEVTLYGGTLPPNPTPVTPPVIVPSFNYVYLFARPTLNKPFPLAVIGKGFDIKTLQFVFKGPGCPAIGCVLATNTVQQLTVTQAIGTFTATEVGVYTLNVRNGAGGALSPTTAQFTVKPPSVK